MENTMPGESAKKYGIVRYEPGKHAVVRLDQEMHGAFCVMHGRDGRVPSRAIYDVRCGQQKPWRYLWRRMVEAIEAGVELEKLLEPLRIFERRIREMCARRGDAHHPPGEPR